MPGPKSACFVVLGTCFHFAPAINTIADRIGQHLRPLNIDPKTLFFSWFYAAQRDFTYTSICGSYTPIAQILQQTFRRACAIVEFPDPAANITDDDISAIMQEIRTLPPRDGLKECYDGLREAGWDVYGVTNGGKETSLKYYELGSIHLDKDHLLSCDDIKAAKPDLRVYETANKHLTARGCGGGESERWFVAAHAWDLVAAKKAGFKVAYVASEEHDPCTGIFGEFDLYAEDFAELLQKMKDL